MKTTKKQTQCQRLLAYLKRHKKGITTMESFVYLNICCLHKRISDLEKLDHKITRTREKTPGGAYVTRYKLAK